jgi:hypothetical protein
LECQFPYIRYFTERRADILTYNAFRLPWLHVDPSGTVDGVLVSSKIEYQLYQKRGQNHYHRNMLTGDEQQAISQRYLVDFVHFIKEYLEKELTSKYFSGMPILNNL